MILLFQASDSVMERLSVCCNFVKKTAIHWKVNEIKDQGLVAMDDLDDQFRS